MPQVENGHRTLDLASLSLSTKGPIENAESVQNSERQFTRYSLTGGL